MTMQIIHIFLEDVVYNLTRISDLSISYKGECLFKNSNNIIGKFNDSNKEQNYFNFEYLNSEISETYNYSKQIRSS